jgi:prevent-host-death family protein
MAEVGVRELKAHLSRYLRQVQSGATIRVTQRGRTVATLQPPDTAVTGAAWARQMVAEGLASWSGGKPGGARPVTPRAGARPASALVIEDRG